ncbi:hypothetical protein B0H17DRAFT_1140758 [Mycena rosella]|uniref:Uncharacterized protein n=1 Tax=Mycena rosella TaxID=1033263 RepID=A0AAD7GBK1_MYCRO|nr:hypothetical protein B0H17DRAFT_1140758 [Mycena rosella]
MTSAILRVLLADFQRLQILAVIYPDAYTLQLRCEDYRFFEADYRAVLLVSEASLREWELGADGGGRPLGHGRAGCEAAPDRGNHRLALCRFMALASCPFAKKLRKREDVVDVGQLNDSVRRERVMNIQVGDLREHGVPKINVSGELQGGHQSHKRQCFENREQGRVRSYVRKPEADEAAALGQDMDVLIHCPRVPVHAGQRQMADMVGEEGRGFRIEDFEAGLLDAFEVGDIENSVKGSILSKDYFNAARDQNQRQDRLWLRYGSKFQDIPLEIHR